MSYGTLAETCHELGLALDAIAPTDDPWARVMHEAYVSTLVRLGELQIAYASEAGYDSMGGYESCDVAEERFEALKQRLKAR